MGARGAARRPLGGRRGAFAIGALALGLAGAGCGSGAEVSTPEPPLPLSPALVSEPLARVSPQEGVAYVSAAPGAFPTGRLARIRNPANGRQEEVRVVDGGWDPVAIAAESGDTLRISITTEQGATLEYANPVPPVYRPVIVRTDPPPRKRDVPLNAIILVVFSEPIDPSSITPERVQLRRGGQPVDAAIALSADGLRLTVHPGGELAPASEYVLVVSPDLSDLTGHRLETGAEVEFSTASVVTIEALGLAFVRGTDIVGSAQDGSEPVALVPEASRPAWSPDGTRLAFTRPADNSLARWQLCIARADGTDIRCATGAEDGNVMGGPSWSPDGSKVAFGVFIHSCPGGQCGQFGGYFAGLSLLNTVTMQVETLPTRPARAVSWSPDGRKIAISIWEPATSEPGTYGVLGTVNPDGTGLEILTTALGTYSVTDVAWSPDGTRLALTLWDDFACPWFCDTAIGVIRADGAQLRILDRVRAADDVYLWTPPAWSPDGTYLGYTISRGGGCSLHNIGCNEIAVVHLDSGRIGHFLSNAGFPSWRP